MGLRAAGAPQWGRRGRELRELRRTRTSGRPANGQVGSALHWSVDADCLWQMQPLHHRIALLVSRVCCNSSRCACARAPRTRCVHLVGEPNGFSAASIRLQLGRRAGCARGRGAVLARASKRTHCLWSVANGRLLVAGGRAGGRAASSGQPAPDWGRARRSQFTLTGCGRRHM